jgi:hypothetical protein
MSGRDYKDNTNTNTNTNTELSVNDSIESLNRLSYEEIYRVLISLGKSEDEIQSTLKKIKEVKDKVHKVVKKFRHKVERKYGFLDETALIKKAMAYATKGKLTNSERDTFIQHLLNGNDKLYYDGYLRHSNMSSFLGYSRTSQILNSKAKDQVHLNELVALYNASKSLYYDVRMQNLTYTDCPIEVLASKFKKDKHIVTQHIHPIVAMLLIPKVKCISRRMIKPNIGRLVLSRAPLISSKMNLYDNIMPEDIEAEFELGYAISQDPNSTNVFTDETPVENLTKRFKCQIELWKNIINLRSGRFFSRAYDANDGITGFMRILDGYNKIQYDVNDNFNMQDEGTILKKMLGLFSIRPTLAQVSTSQAKMQVGYSNISGLSRVTILSLPVVNIRLPAVNTNIAAEPVALVDALEQIDVFLKHKQLVPMNKSIIKSSEMIFFHAHRKQRTLNSSLVSVSYKNIALTPSFIGVSSLNKTPLHFNQYMAIGTENFAIKGVIVLHTAPDLELITGCSASFIANPDHERGMNEETYHTYNPLASGTNVFNDQTGQYEDRNPIERLIAHADDDSQYEGFFTLAFTNGCIFWFLNQNLNE